MDVEVIVERLRDWLPGLRWYPYSSASDIVLVEHEVIDNIYFMKIRSHGETFYLPLALTSEKPSGEICGRYLEVDGKYLVEAEFTSNYIDVLSRAGFITAKQYTRIPMRVIKAYPLTLGTTNVLVVNEVIGGRIVVKSYRKLPRPNLEPLVIDALACTGFKYIPSVIALYSWGDDVVSIAMEYIVGEGDGGKPFYESFLNHLNGVSRPRLGLASLLGVEIALFHKTISSINNELFRPETIDERDIGYWVDRVSGMVKNALENMDKLVDRYKWIDYWRSVADKLMHNYLNEFIHDIEKYLGLKKIRTHQDLHLGQFIYSPSRGFIFTDFEGEPARSMEERLFKEPCTRDLATLLRSFQYLTFTAYTQYVGGDTDSIGRRLLENRDQFIGWRALHEKAVIYSYLGELLDKIPDIIGVEKSSVGMFIKMLRPWVIEKAVYEIYYESMYRPEMIPIPIVGLRYVDEELRLLSR